MTKLGFLSYVTLLLISSTTIFAQQRVTFKTSDNLTVTADYYETEMLSNKVMILCHQAEYSRGEYKDIATKLIKLGYNCLAIDLRYGNEVNYTTNETATMARQTNFPRTMLDCEKDITAAIEYTQAIVKGARLYLWGSSFSASLCLMIAQQRSDISSVVAFSPGEFFDSNPSVKDKLSGYKKPSFVACTQSEYSYMADLFSKADQNNITFFKPERGEGMHGSKTLWWDSSTRNEYWLALMFFLRDK